jgi:peptidoglycan/xylan/chitin deacetylase (PgdA/CDA1 family)
VVALGLLGASWTGRSRSAAALGATPPAAKATVGQPLPSATVDAFWARAKQEVYKSPQELTAQRMREIRKGLPYAELVRGAPRMSTVALTFDDGPHPDFTLRLLAILDRYNVKATFFVVGEMAEKYPSLILAEQNRGHVVGNHTYHHVNLTKIPVLQVRVEYQACQDVVRTITGDTPRFCRPPGGDYDGAVIDAARSLGLTTVLWTDDPGDYASPGAGIIKARVLDRVGNGGIILLHDGIQQTLDVLPQIIERLQKRGLR